MEVDSYSDENIVSIFPQRLSIIEFLQYPPLYTALFWLVFIFINFSTLLGEVCSRHHMVINFVHGL